jgi:hypothetical protein
MVMDGQPSVINLVFDGPPGPQGPHLVEIADDDGRSVTLPPDGPLLVEIEDDAGHSIAVGRWVDRGDGYWALRIPCRPDSSVV